jgi:hypothetical protein
MNLDSEYDAAQARQDPDIDPYEMSLVISRNWKVCWDHINTYTEN